MKKHISIFAFLLGAFAAGLAPEAGAAGQTVYGGYYYYGQDYQRDRSADRMSVEGSEPKTYTAQDLGNGEQVTFVAAPPPGMVVSDWGTATDGSAVQRDTGCSWTGSTSLSYLWTGKPADGDRHLAVKFAYVPLVIAFNGGDGGSGSMAPVTGLNIDSEFTLPANEFTKTGYRFSGWKTNETKGVVFADKATLKGGVFWNGKAFDSTLYAQWAANAYSVGCELNGGAWSAGYEPPARAVYDEVFSLPAPTRTGYDFAEWKVTSGLDTTTARWGTDKNPSKSITADEPCFNGDKEVYFKNLNPTENATVTLTAQWQAATITVTFNNHGGTSGGGLLDTLKVTYDAAYPALNPPTKDGHDFMGYAIGAETYWGSDGQPTKATWDIPTDCTADAQWEAKVYQVTYHENRSDGKPSATHVTDVTHGVPTALYDGADFSNPGCVLLGWSTSSGAKIPDEGYALGGSVTFDKPDNNLYAVWEKSYFIAYDGNGATGGTPMETRRFVIGKEGQTLDPNTYAKTGYSFFGWATNRAAALLLDRKYADRAMLPPDIGVGQGETNTLFAVWATNTYYVAFDPNGGTGPAMPVLTNTYDTAFKLPKATYSNGAYDFAGWRDDVAGVVYTNLNESVSNLCTVANGTNTLTAVWELEPLSAAMHCGNLKWELGQNQQLLASNPWKPLVGAGVGHGSDSCVRQTGASTSSQYWLVAQVDTTGSLSFSWKPTGCDGVLRFWVGSKDDFSLDALRLSGTDGSWLTFSTNGIPAGSWIHFYFYSSVGTCDIDRMTWTPEGFVPVTNAVPVAAAGLVYDGTLKTGVPTGAGYMIEGNRATDAGDYTATATLTDGHVWEGGSQAPTNIAWTIAKATYDMGGVTITNGTYEADGTAKSIFVSGALPPGVTVAYEGNGQTEPGTYTVTAKFAGDERNYEAIPDKTAKLTILKREDPPVPPEPVITNAVPVAVTGLVYDGTAKTGVAAGANYTIVGNVATNAGDYVATATVTNGVWEGGFGGATNIAWTIAKGTKDLSGISFPDAAFQYDGRPHSFGIVGELPEGVSVAYDGETSRTEVGTNTVTASFIVADPANWNAITTTLTAKLVITPKDEPPPPDPAVAYENIYFRASLADLGAAAVPTDHKITIKAEGLPKGLKLKTLTVAGRFEYLIEGVATELMDGRSRIAYVRVTDNKVQTLYRLQLAVRPASEYESKSFPDGRIASDYVRFSVTNLWPGISADPRNWALSGWPSGIKYAAKATKDVLAYEVYGKPTKAGRFTVKAVEKIAGTSYKSTHVATFTVWPDACEPEPEWTDRAYEGVYRASGADVTAASGLPTGIKFTAKDVTSGGEVVAEAHHFYGMPTKAGTFAVTLTHADKTKTQFLWTITPAAAPCFELKLTKTEVDPLTAKATIRQGVAYEWAVANTLGSKVSASGLPSGLKLKSTAIKDGRTTIGYAYSVRGVPTKAGEYFATFTTKMNGVTTVTTAAFTVLALEPWAQGTFNGGADGSFPSGGQVNLTLSKVGKLSGKWMSQGTNWTLSAASYDRYDSESGSYVALMIGKTGSGTKAVSFTNELTVSKANAEYLGGVATDALFIGYQNVWKTEPWKTIGKKFAKAGTVVLRPGVVGTNDTITLKFAASGTVTAAGKFEKSVDAKGKVSYYSVSASTVLCPQGDPDGYGAFDGVVFVYFPPKAKTPLPDGYSVCVWVRWDGSVFAELPSAGDE